MSGASADPGQDPRGAPDLMPIWTILDTTPEGRGTDWYPKLKHFQAKHALGLNPEVDTGSRWENASKQKTREPRAIHSAKIRATPVDFRIKLGLPNNGPHLIRI